MIFTIGDVIVLLIVVAVLIVYRQLDRSNRSLEKVRRYADKVVGELDELIETKTVELRNLSIELDVHQKSSKEALKRIAGIREDVVGQIDGVDDVKRRLNEYDRSLGELIEMTKAVDENLQRLHSESEFVDTVGKRLREATATMDQLEKNIPALRHEFGRQNADQMKSVSSEVIKSVEDQVGSITEQVSRSESIVNEFSEYVSRLETRRDQMEEDTVEGLRTRFQGFVEQADNSRRDMTSQFEADIESILERTETNARELARDIEKDHERLSEHAVETQNDLNEKLEAFQDRMNSIEEEYQRTLREAAERGRELEDEVFSRLKDHIEGRARSLENTLSVTMGETKERLEKSRKELVKMFGDTRSEITVWRAELQKRTDGSIVEFEKRFEQFSAELEASFSAATDRGSAHREEQKKKLEEFIEVTGTEIDQLESQISSRVAELAATIGDREREFSDRLDAATGRGEDAAKSARAEIDGRIAGFRDDLQTRFASLESSVKEYEEGLAYRVDGLSGLHEQIDQLGVQLHAHMEQTGARIRDELGEVLDEAAAERDSEKRRGEEQLAQVRSSMETIDHELTDLKTRAYENVSEKLQVFEDDFFSDLKERGANLERRLQSWQEELSGRLDSVVDDQQRQRQELEERYNINLEERLSELMDSTTGRYKRFDSQVAGFENRISERITDAEESVERLERNVREELGALTENSSEQFEQQLNVVRTDLTERLEEHERVVTENLKNLTEGFETGKRTLISSMESTQSDVNVWQVKVLQQLRETETGITSDVESLRSEIHDNVEKLKETYRTQREELIVSSEEERKQLAQELLGVQSRIGALEAGLEERAEESMTAMNHQAEKFLEELGEKTKIVQDEVDDRIRDFRTQVQDMRDKIDASQQKLYGSIEENYKILSVNIQEIEKKQKSFLDQTKLFERADTMKAALVESVETLKSEIVKSEERSKDIRASEREYAKIRKIGEEISERMSKFVAEKRRFDSMDDDFKRLMNISQSVDSKLEEVTSTHDALQETQARIRNLEEIEKEVSLRYDRLEKRKQIVESTTAAVDGNFKTLQELDKAIRKIEVEFEPLPDQLSRLDEKLGKLSQDKPRADEAVRALERLDSTVAEIEDRIERMQTAREWLARTETRLEEINAKAEGQLELMRSLLKDDVKTKRDGGPPSRDTREMVTKLVHQGWTVKEIVKTTGLSRGEVELILELPPKE